MDEINKTLLANLPKQDHLYMKTHISIEAGYIWGKGIDEVLQDKFYSEMEKLFTDAGWTIEGSHFRGACPTFHKEKNKLYCHPSQLSGPLEPDLLSEVETLINKATTCKLRYSENYDQIYDMTDEQYKEALETCKKDIQKDIMEAFKTKRRNLYHYLYDIDHVYRHYRIPTLTNYIGISSNDVYIKYINEVFESMVQSGDILPYKHPTKGTLYRTITKAEKEMLQTNPSLMNKIQDAQSRTENKAGEGSTLTKSHDDIEIR